MAYLLVQFHNTGSLFVVTSDLPKDVDGTQKEFEIGDDFELELVSKSELAKVIFKGSFEECDEYRAEIIAEWANERHSQWVAANARQTRTFEETIDEQSLTEISIESDNADTMSPNKQLEILIKDSLNKQAAIDSTVYEIELLIEEKEELISRNSRLIAEMDDLIVQKNSKISGLVNQAFQNEEQMEALIEQFRIQNAHRLEEDLRARENKPETLLAETLQTIQANILDIEKSIKGLRESSHLKVD